MIIVIKNERWVLIIFLCDASSLVLIFRKMFPKKLVPDVVVNDECDFGDVCDADGESTVDEESDLDNFALDYPIEALEQE